MKNLSFGVFGNQIVVNKSKVRKLLCFFTDL